MKLRQWGAALLVFVFLSLCACSSKKTAATPQMQMSNNVGTAQFENLSNDMDGNGSIADAGDGETVDDGTADDGTVDDGTADDGTIDDGTVDDGTVDDGTVDDGTVDDEAQDVPADLEPKRLDPDIPDIGKTEPTPPPVQEEKGSEEETAEQGAAADVSESETPPVEQPVEEKTDTQSAEETGAESANTDSGAVSGANTDADADVDTNTEADVDTDAEADGDTEPDSKTETTDTDIDTGTYIDEDAEGGNDADDRADKENRDSDIQELLMPDEQQSIKHVGKGWMIACIVMFVLLVAGSAYVWLQRKHDEKTDPNKKQKEPDDIIPTMQPMPSKSTIGKVHEQGARENQQDCFGVSDEEIRPDEPFLAIVADGMGGLSGGEEVSKAIVSEALNAFISAKGGHTPRLESLLVNAKQAVDQKLGASMVGRSGSTVVMGLLQNGVFDYISVGDSRICLYRDGNLYLLNRSHIYARELLIDAINGEKTFAQVAKDRQAACLTSYIGMGDLRYVDYPDEPLKTHPGDKFVLMSDGVFNALKERELSEALAHEVQIAASEIKRRIQEKNYPHQDNYTAVILQC